ncbi:MAG: DJ-1/PfpI family protein [Clostridioides difficile]|nr:DJ-1/PfpI family protein [Clostridioides difficile]
MDVNILLFNDFESLDAIGPVSVFGRINDYNLQYFSIGGQNVTSKQGIEINTKSVSEIDQTGILLIPGGQGTRDLVNDNTFISNLTLLAEKSKYCLSVCTGSALLAKTNLLNNKKATSNKLAFEWVKSNGEYVKWISDARWVVDGKFYTSSGVSAGIDMCLGFISDVFNKELAIDIANKIEYIWNSNKENDPFKV